MRVPYAQVKKQVWSDPDFLALSDSARLLFLWTWTNEWANLAGLYRVDREEIARALDRDAASIVTALEELAAKPMVLYEQPVSMLWVVNRARHVNTSPRATAAMLAAFQRQPECELKRLWRQRYAGQWGVPSGERATASAGGTRLNGSRELNSQRKA